jgi:hypothetical protein
VIFKYARLCITSELYFTLYEKSIGTRSYFIKMRGTECLCKSSIIIHYMADDSRNMLQWNQTPVVQGVWPAASPWPILSATLSVSVPSRFIKHNVPWRCLTKCDAIVSGSIPTFRIIHACHSKEVPALFLPLSLSISQLLYVSIFMQYYPHVSSLP